MKKNPKQIYNASESAEYLGVSRQYFYILKRKHQIEPVWREYNMPFFAALDLMKIKKLLAK